MKLRVKSKTEVAKFLCELIVARTERDIGWRPVSMTAKRNREERPLPLFFSVFTER